MYKNEPVSATTLPSLIYRANNGICRKKMSYTVILQKGHVLTYFWRRADEISMTSTRNAADHQSDLNVYSFAEHEKTVTFCTVLYNSSCVYDRLLVADR